MKKRYLFAGINAILLSAFMIPAVCLMSCKDDDKETGEPKFEIEGDPIALSVPVEGKTQAYTVRSNRPWKIVAQSQESWVRAFPDEGDDDGIFKFIVEKNAAFSSRMVNFAFVVDGKEQPTLFRVEQAANVPYITIKDAAGIKVPAAGGDVTVSIDANVPWTYTLTDGSWLTQPTVTATSVKYVAEPNNDPVRVATLTVSSTAYPDLTKTVKLTQASLSTTILEEDFNWLPATYGNKIIYNTTPSEKRYSTWTEEEQNRGWSGTVINDETTGNAAWLYAREGYVKLGKTRVGGDLISPKLTNLQGTQNVTVTFKACGYQTATGTKDTGNEVNIFITGGGTASPATFNANYYKSQADGGDTYTWQDDPQYVYSFTITGATAETQIRFVGGPNIGPISTLGGNNNNRIGIDDIKVVVKE